MKECSAYLEAAAGKLQSSQPYVTRPEIRRATVAAGQGRLQIVGLGVFSASQEHASWSQLRKNLSRRSALPTYKTIRSVKPHANKLLSLNPKNIEGYKGSTVSLHLSWCGLVTPPHRSKTSPSRMTRIVRPTWDEWYSLHVGLVVHVVSSVLETFRQRDQSAVSGAVTGLTCDLTSEQHLFLQYWTGRSDDCHCLNLL